jgi:hypothetical protein
MGTHALKVTTKRYEQTFELYMRERRDARDALIAIPEIRERQLPIRSRYLSSS